MTLKFCTSYQNYKSVWELVKRHHKKSLVQIRLWKYERYSLLFGTYTNEFVYNKQTKLFFAGYPLVHLLDSHVVLLPISGAAGYHGCWVQLFGDGSTKFLQQIPLTVHESYFDVSLLL
jgi:hypothetical protein